MKNSNSQISFYVDTMIVETLLSNENLFKTAESGFISSLGEKIKNYVHNSIDENDKAGSLMNIVIPGLISVLVGGWMGPIIGFLLRVFNIDTAGILKSIYGKLKGIISGKVSSGQIDQIVSSTIQEHSPSESSEEYTKEYELLKAHSYSKDLREAKLLKLAITNFSNKTETEKIQMQRVIQAGLGFGASKLKYLGLLGKLLGWIFKVVFASAGLMVAADAAKKLFKAPNAFDGPKEQAAPTVVSTQTKFPTIKPIDNSPINSVSITNTKPNIEQMVINFAKEVYSGLDGQENNIRSSNSFNILVNSIVWHNSQTVGDPVVWIPSNFTSKKQLVDHFIDEVAEKAS